MSGGNIELYHMDNMELMAQYPDNYFELAIVDPPYGIGASKPSKKPGLVTQRNGNILKVNDSAYTPKNWDKKPAGAEYFNELIRVSKNQIIWGVNYYDYKFKYQGRIIWDKLNGQSDQIPYEVAYCSSNHNIDGVYFLWSGMFQGIYCGRDLKKALIQQGDKTKNEKRIHPTQKPVKLYEWLLQNYANEGDKILDTHLGSGSIAIACHRMKFDLVACEIDQEYYEAAVNRLENERAQMVLL